MRFSCTVTLELQTNTHLEQFQVLMNSENSEKCTAYFVY